jgi:hypothetical protein
MIIIIEVKGSEKWAWPNLRHYPVIFLAGLKEIEGPI